jgi:transposase
MKSNTNEKNELINIIYYSQSNRQVKTRALAVLLSIGGMKTSEIAKTLSIHQRTVSKHVKKYENEGIEALTKDKRYRPVSELDNYTELLKKEFEERPCATVKEAKHRIEKLTGVKRELTQVRKFLKRIGLKPLRTGHVPAKADVVRQREFVEKELEVKLNEVNENKREVFFVDASHFVLAAFLGVLWTFTRVFIPSPSGRNRFNVLGALNAKTLKLTIVTNDTYINAISICELLDKLIMEYPEKLLTIVLDNARYQKCKKVTEYAEKLGIELLYLPPYSPNLNLIERVWKYIKSDCLNSAYYENFKEFKIGITKCIEQINNGSRDKDLKSLLTWKFQMFDKEKIIYKNVA